MTGLWVLWFVVAERRWRDLAMIAATSVLAVLPLTPILLKYITVHTRHGFERSLFEMRLFSADVASLLCAPGQLSIWGWLQVGCRQEGTLFPGLTVLALCGIWVWRGLRRPGETALAVTVTRRALYVVAVAAALAACAVLVVGPWHIDAGWLRASSTSARKPSLIALAALGLALLLSPGMRAAFRSRSTMAFYILAACAAWLLALGPTVAYMGVPTGVSGPFSWLLALPGVSGLRVPARFWTMAVLCLSVAAGLSVSRIVRGRSTAPATMIVLAVGLGVLADGWFDRIPVAPVPVDIPGAAALRGKMVIELPLDAGFRDTAAVYRAVEGGWKAVNGYSGYFPVYYQALRSGVRTEAGHMLTPLRRLDELFVVVPSDASHLIDQLERIPGRAVLADSASSRVYRVPRIATESQPQLGRRLPVVALRSACETATLGLALDGDESTLWDCPGEPGLRNVTIDVGAAVAVGAIVHSAGRQSLSSPFGLHVTTSEDGVTWQDAWSGSPLEEAFDAGMNDPRLLRLTLRFPQRPARYIRIDASAGDVESSWSIAELEAWAGTAQPPDHPASRP